MPVHMDPATVKPQRGILLVEIVEKMGGVLKSGLFAPIAAHDNSRKDTVIVKVLKMGPPAELYHTKKHTVHLDVRPNPGKPWTPEMFPVEVGNFLMVPRDIPLIITWKERRYGLVKAHESIAVFGSYTGHEDVMMVPHAM